MPLIIPLSSLKNALQERLPLLGMSHPQVVEEELLLRQKIERCEEYKKTIRDRLAEEKDEKAALLYLKGKTYDEWMMLYDTLIHEARSELEALGALPDVAESRQVRKALLLASGVTAAFFFLMTLFFLPEPMSVLTGNVIGASAGGSFDIDVFFGTISFLAVIFGISYAVMRIGK